MSFAFDLAVMIPDSSRFLVLVGFLAALVAFTGHASQEIFNPNSESAPTDCEGGLSETLEEGIFRARGYLIGLSRELREEQNWTAAEERLKELLALDPKDTFTLAQLAHVLAQRGRHREATQLHERILAIDGPTQRNLAAHANSLHNEGRLQEAEAAYDRLLGEFPDDWRGLKQKAILLARLGRRQEAESLALHALNFAPRGTRIWLPPRETP